MITLTPSAKNHIETILKNKGVTAAFRLTVKKTGCSGYLYVPEIVLQKKENDIEIPTENFLIYIDPAAIPMLQGTIIDYVNKSLGVSQLVFQNPNAMSVCGCGESFNIKTNSQNTASEQSEQDCGR